jgi:polyisoprenoid-binding protein YceI
MLAVGLSTLVPLVTAARANAQPIQAKADISFEGHSTLHDFEGHAQSLTFDLVPAADGTRKATVTLPVASLDTGNSSRDKRMRSMLDGVHFPQIVATFDVDPAGVRPEGETPGKLPFLLRIRDIEHPVTAVVSDWSETKDHAEFDATFLVSLDAYKLKAPRALLFIKVGDTVDVRVHVALERK